MSRVDELPADQRAALSLLLRQRKSYADVAKMLGIPERAVHDRAHSALAVLAPKQARGIEAAKRQEIGDYLLGQQSADLRLRTRTLLAGGGAPNAWASAVARELAPLGEATAVPPSGELGRQEPVPLSQVAATAASSSSSSSSPPPTAPASALNSTSRPGGAILLAFLAAAIIVAVILIVSDNGSSSDKTASTRTTSTSASTPKREGTISLHAPSGSDSSGTVEILSEGGKRAFFIQAEHIPASKGFFYAVWLYSSPKRSLALSKSPPVGKTHKLAGAALLPSNASSYKEILLTRETKTRPKHPGHIVLRGLLKIG